MSWYARELARRLACFFMYALQLCRAPAHRLAFPPSILCLARAHAPNSTRPSWIGAHPEFKYPRVKYASPPLQLQPWRTLLSRHPSSFLVLMRRIQCFLPSTPLATLWHHYHDTLHFPTCSRTIAIPLMLPHHCSCPLALKVLTLAPAPTVLVRASVLSSHHCVYQKVSKCWLNGSVGK